MFVQNKLLTTTHMNIAKPTKNIGFLPTMSAALGKIKEPTKQPAIKEEPSEPIFTSDAQYRFIYSTQLCKLSTES